MQLFVVINYHFKNGSDRRVGVCLCEMMMYLNASIATIMHCHLTKTYTNLSVLSLVPAQIRGVASKRNFIGQGAKNTNQHDGSVMV